MRKVIITKDSADTYEIEYIKDSSAEYRKGGIFSHDVPKFIKDMINEEDDEYNELSKIMSQ